MPRPHRLPDRSRVRRGGRPDPRALPVEQVRDRLSSYVYGNITVLAAAIAVDPDAIHHGTAVWAVLGTAVLTYAAHVLAHLVAHGIGDDGPRTTSVGSPPSRSCGVRTPSRPPA